MVTDIYVPHHTAEAYLAHIKNIQDFVFEINEIKLLQKFMCRLYACGKSK